MQLDEVLAAPPAIPAINTEVTWFDTDRNKRTGGVPGNLQHGGIIGIIKATGQAVTLRVKMADVVGDDSKLVTVNGKGLGVSSPAGVPTEFIVPFGAARVVVTLATGGTVPSAWFGTGRITERPLAGATAGDDSGITREQSIWNVAAGGSTPADPQGDLASSNKTRPFVANMEHAYAHLILTGTPTGTVTIFASGNHDPNNLADLWNGNWESINTTLSPSLTQPAGAGASYLVDLGGVRAVAYYADYARSSGAGGARAFWGKL